MSKTYAPSLPPRRGAPPKYDWDRWFARKRFTIRQGVDYEIPQGSMSQQIRNQASKRRVRVTVMEGESVITVLVRGERK